MLDNTQLGYRVLRADHSLLGGEWHYKPRGVREPIYSIFVILEAVRLVDPPPVNTKPRALAIGLGVGTSVDALIRHGVQTDIVELDPAVYRYAGEYFGLSSNHTAYLEDAISFVKTRGPERQGTYDFVLHDVFTGGAVPAGLFTREFFRGLERMMKDDGVVAVNWAGDLGGDRKEVRAILETIREVFGSGCRSFREDEEKEKKEGDKEDFTNMVSSLRITRTPHWPDVTRFLQPVIGVHFFTFLPFPYTFSLGGRLEFVFCLFLTCSVPFHLPFSRITSPYSASKYQDNAGCQTWRLKSLFRPLSSLPHSWAISTVLRCGLIQYPHIFPSLTSLNVITPIIPNHTRKISGDLSPSPTHPHPFLSFITAIDIALLKYLIHGHGLS